MDHGNGTKTYLTDGDADKKPQIVGTPGTLLSPDRYEFYSFGEDGELVKKLMTLDQIQSLIAGGDELEPLPAYDPQPLVDSTHTEGVHKVLESVQNVLKGELQAAKVNQKVPMPLPDDSWSILLPGLLNSDLDFKEPHIPLKTEATSSTTATRPQSTSRLPSTSATTRKPPTTTTTRGPVNQATVSQQFSTVRSTTQATEPAITKKTTTDTKFTSFFSTSSPYIKTTGHVLTKPVSQKPHVTTKRPISSTKKPYISESPYDKVPLSNTPKPEAATKPTPTTKKPTVEERLPSTKFPEIKKPLPEKQKPSGIPTITHYLPISSISPSNSSIKLTTPSFAESSVSNQKFSATSKEPIRVTTTKRPSTFPTSQTTVQKATRRPVQNKVPTNNHKTQTNNKIQNDKVMIKNPKPTVTTTTATKHQYKTTTAPNTTAMKETTIPIVTKVTAMTTEKLETHSTTDIEPTTIKESLLPSPEKLVLDKKPDVKPESNLVGLNSDIVHTKVKPSEAHLSNYTSSTATLVSSQKWTQSSTPSPTTPFPDKITTFSYTSKITPNGQIITSTYSNFNYTQQKPTTGTSIETPAISSTQKPTTTSSIKITEKPSQKLTISSQQSSNPIEQVRDQILVSSSMQPTTYHPHNFSLPSKKPTFQITSTTPLPSTLVKVSTISEQQKYTTVADSSPTERPTRISTTAIKTSPLLSSSTIPIATTLQEATKPTTLFVNVEETTAGSTAIIANTTSETTINDSTTYSTEEMPLQEIPLKIYESLKDNINSAQDIMTTIFSENLSTTPAKIENVYSTDFEETTVPSTTTSTDITTILDVISSTNFPVSQNKVVIINNSEPQILEKNSISKISENETSATTNEPIPSTTDLPFTMEQKSNTTFDNKTQNETTFSTTIPANISDMENLETTPNLDSTTIYKDQILQEGISAVTSILLDEAEKHQAIKQAILAAAIKNNENMDMERFKTTTENERISTTISDSTESSTEKFVTDGGDQMKSEVRISEDAELPDKFTTETVETTTVKEKQKPEVSSIKEESKETTINSNTKHQLKKTEQKTTLVLPTKESKLNPDSGHEIVKKAPEKLNPENIPLLRTSPVPEFSATTERLKPSDLEKPIHKPLSPFAKKPSSVYQSLENLPPVAIELNPAPYESMGLEASIAFLGEDVRRFADLCNELAFKLWTSITGKGQIASRSLVMSPFAVTSLLAMVFLGARGPTSGQMNDVLRLDDMVTFNPHQVLQNVTESVINSKNHGVATAAFVRELYSDKTKGKILDFYKERVQQYYQGHVEEVAFTTIGDIIRRRTNLLVKRQTLGKVPEYLRGSSLNMRPPLAAFSANIFQTDCEHGSTEGRDGEMYFVVRPSTRQRRLVPVPAVVWRSGFLAGYETSLDATSVCLGPESVVSTILILPGQQGQVAPGDGLARLEQRLIETTYRRGGWSQILRSLMPRPGLELQIPRFSHRSVLNVTGALQRMGLRDLFNARRADLRGLNGLSNDLHLSDMLQVNTFSTCGEETIGARHHVETYPASPQRMGRDEPEHYPPRDFDSVFGEIPLSLRPRQARLPDNPRLRFDRPFLYMVRHNPSGMILHMGRFNPRLLP